MQPPQRGIPRLLAMKDPTNPVLMHMSPMEAQQITAMRGQGFNPQTGLPVLGRAEGGMVQPEKPPYADVAQELEEKGRYGDTHLLHVRDDELQGLSSLGQLTINPDTGLPEAFSFKSLLPAIGAIAGAALAPVTFGSSMWAVGAMAGLGSFAGGLAAGQGVGQAALGGLMSGVTAGFLSGAPTGLDAIGSEGVMGGVGELGVEAAFTGVGEAVPGAIGSTTASIAGNTAASQVASASAAGLTAAPTPIGPPLLGQPLGPPIPLRQTIAPLRSNIAANPSFLSDQAANVASRQALTTTAPNIPAGAFARIDPTTYKPPNEFKQFFGADDLNKVSSGDLGGGYLTRSQSIDAGMMPSDMSFSERAGQLASSPSTYIGAVGNVLTQPPEYGEFEEEDLTLSGSSYIPRTRRLVGGEQRPAGTTEEIRNRYIQGGDAQPLVSPYRFVASGGLIGLSEGGMTNGNYSSYSSNNDPSFNGGGQPEQMSFLPISLQHMMNRIGATDPAPFIEFAKRTRDVESSGGRDRINDKSSARGNYQWLTKVDPKAKKGEHNSVKTAANRLQKIYRDAEQDIPQWLKTLNINSTKSTKDLEKNVLSLTSEQEDQLFYANINLADGSDQYLPLIAQGDTEAMLNAYGEIHHTNMKKPTRDVAENIFLSEFKIDAPSNVGQGTGLNSISQDVVSETMVDERINTPYTVQQGDTLSQLAAQSGISVDDIMKANLGKISNPDKIYTGQQIALSDSSDIPNPVSMDSQGDKSSMDSILETLKQFIPGFAEGGGISQYYAEGGDIGRYYEGQVVGQGDGMSDQMLFEVEGNNPDKALLSRDEYVIPADVVAMLGNGSSNAGAEQLDHFMKGIRQQSFGTTKQQKQMNPQQGLAQLA